MTNDDPLQQYMDVLVAAPAVRVRWDDVLRRAGESSRDAGDSRTQPRGGQRTVLGLFVILAVAAALVVVPALALSGQLRSIFGFSNSGSRSDAGALRNVGFGAWQKLVRRNEVRLLGTRAGIAFYAGRDRDGTLCFATEVRAAPPPREGALGCFRGASRFPSAQQPILDFSPVASGGTLRGTHVAALIGFAADDVARVGVVDESGAIHSVQVIDNIYATRKGFLPDTPMKALVALDRKGRTIFERRYVP